MFSFLGKRSCSWRLRFHSPFLFVFFFKQKTAYEILRSDWSSDVCSSDLFPVAARLPVHRRQAGPQVIGNRSEERRVGKECVSTCRSRWSPDHYKKKKKNNKPNQNECNASEFRPSESRS